MQRERIIFRYTGLLSNNGRKTITKNFQNTNGLGFEINSLAKNVLETNKDKIFDQYP